MLKCERACMMRQPSPLSAPSISAATITITPNPIHVTALSIVHVISAGEYVGHRLDTGARVPVTPRAGESGLTRARNGPMRTAAKSNSIRSPRRRAG
jgi:hypothetical protein